MAVNKAVDSAAAIHIKAAAIQAAASQRQRKCFVRLWGIRVQVVRVRGRERIIAVWNRDSWQEMDC